MQPPANSPQPTPASTALIGILTVSDRASRGDYADEGGPAIRDYLTEVLTSPWEARQRLVPDELPAIAAAMRRASRRSSPPSAAGWLQPGLHRACSAEACPLPRHLLPMRRLRHALFCTVQSMWRPRGAAGRSCAQAPAVAASLTGFIIVYMIVMTSGCDYLCSLMNQPPRGWRQIPPG